MIRLPIESTLMKALLLTLILLISKLTAQDVVIYGSTPGGIAAAISAARLVRAVTLVEYARRKKLYDPIAHALA
jgi:NADPH-dependent 2,4-dienoyl-CoA reductase/sulfur reductase-like enzyme